MTSLDALDIRRRLGRKHWGAPIPFGPDGWILDSLRGHGRIIVTVAEFDEAEWIHASISWHDRMPSYEDMKMLHRAVLGGWAYEVFAPAADHVNIHQFARHLWSRLDGAPALPVFSLNGSI